MDTLQSLPELITPFGTIEAIRPDGRGRHTIFAPTQTLGAHKRWFSPDGAASSSRAPYNEDLCVINADGTHLVNITNTPEVLENGPTWAPAARNQPQDRAGA
jgi:hypothetical protein